MQSPSKFLGMVRVWQDGEQWKWTPADQWAPENALLGNRYADHNGDDVIYAQRSPGHGPFIRGAIPGAVHSERFDVAQSPAR